MCVASVDAPIFIFKRVCVYKYICSLTLGEAMLAFAVMDTHMYITHTPTLSLSYTYTNKYHTHAQTHKHASTHTNKFLTCIMRFAAVDTSAFAVVDPTHPLLS